MSPGIGPKDCGITRRRILLLGAELERGAMVQEDLSVGPPVERRRESRRQAYKPSLTWSENATRDGRWAALSVVHATSRISRLPHCRILRCEITVGLRQSAVPETSSLIISARGGQNLQLFG